MSNSDASVILIQIEAVVGDLEGNCGKILEACGKFPEADIAVSPELSVCGYPPEDLIFHESFLRDCEAKVRELAEELKAFPRMHVLVGYPLARDGKVFNAVSVLNNGRILLTHRKTFLPNYGVFDERRYFSVPESQQAAVFEVKGTKFGINICEDVWHPDAPRLAKEAGAEVLLIPNASPYEKGKSDLRFKVIADNVTGIGLDAVYVNMTGAQDEIVFDGRSFVCDSQGRIREMASFKEETAEVLIRENKVFVAEEKRTEEGLAHFYQALVTGLAEYVRNNRFKGVVLGLSGGVDSALVLKIAVDALGADKVEAVLMPSRYTSEMSVTDAEELAGNLGVRSVIIPIEPAFKAFKSMLSGEFEGYGEDVTEENLQARIRGMILMAISNKKGLMVATTGNKSEMAVGYSTLYGDLAGGFAVIKDVYKTEVYELCRWINEISEKRVFPENILTRAPSAELRPDQKDQDSLPEYSVLDAILKLYLEQKAEPEKIIESGFSKEDVLKTLRLVKRSEYKRRQAPIGSKMTAVAFGKDWRYPIVNRYGN